LLKLQLEADAGLLLPAKHISPSLTGAVMLLLLSLLLSLLLLMPQPDQAAKPRLMLPSPSLHAYAVCIDLLSVCMVCSAASVKVWGPQEAPDDSPISTAAAAAAAASRR